MKKISVFAPATVANMGCGFDTMGFAFEGAGDKISMRFIEKNEIRYVNNSGITIPLNPEENLMTPALHAIMDATGGRRGVEIIQEQKIIPGSGIGSSAAAAASAVYAYNLLAECGYSAEELIDFALYGEMMASGARHADNVAPALLGGVVIIREHTPLDVFSIKPPEHLYCAIVHPHIEVKTKDSRAVLPQNLSLKTAIRQWANVGALVAALLSADYPLIGRALKDGVAEPNRKQFIPGYDELKAAIAETGALGSNISGSGPSVFALCDSREKADAVKAIMGNHFKKLNISCNTYSSPVSMQGCRAI